MTLEQLTAGNWTISFMLFAITSIRIYCKNEIVSFGCAVAILILVITGIATNTEFYLENR